MNASPRTAAAAAGEEPHGGASARRRPAARHGGALLALVAVAAVLALTGCATVGGPARAVSDAQETAALQAAAGDHAAAARTLEGALQGTEGELRDALLLDAARQWFLADNRGRAVALVNQRSSALPAEGDTLLQLLAAAQALAAQAPETAIARLERSPPPYPPELSAAGFELLGRARFGRGDLVGAVDALVEREMWLTGEAQIAGNAQLIWQELSAPGLPASAFASRTGRPEVDGWLAIAAIARAGESSPGRARSQLAAWQARYPGHPASRRVVPTLLARYRALTTYPTRVALLLPLSGPLARSAAAVRDGFVSAQLAAMAGGVETEVTVLDTQALGPAEAYASALAGGADFVVGPLRKESVVAVARNRGDGTTPTLALNDPGEALREALPPGANFFRYALAPEDEAVQAARRAAREGHLDLVALVPRSRWGERLLASFRAGAEQSPGAALVDFDYFASSAADFSRVIRRVFRLDQSEERYRALRAVVGTPMEFEPRRRADVDALLVAAPASAARLIRPQLRFHLTDNLPVFMTSAALNPDAAANRDVEDVVFADIPWLAADAHAGDPRWEALERYAPDGVRRARLYAFGADAFELVAAIWAGVDAYDDVLVDGLTGKLRAEADGRIVRELSFLRLEGGELVAIPDDDIPAISHRPAAAGTAQAVSALRPAARAAVTGR